MGGYDTTQPLALENTATTPEKAFPFITLTRVFVML